MVVTFLINGKEQRIDPVGTIYSAVTSMGLMPETFVFLIDGTPVPMDTPLTDGITVKSIKVASGG